VKRPTRFWLSIAAVAAVAVGSVIAAIGVYVNEHDNFHRMQHEEAGRAARQVEAVAGLSIGKLSSAAAFFRAERDLNAHEFTVIGHSLLGQGVLSAAGFIPKVSASSRVRFESSRGIEIHERLPGGGTRRAGQRPDYYPLTYVTAVATPRRGIGYDLGADPERFPFLQKARDSGAATATPVIPLLLGGPGVNVYLAIYRDGAPVATLAERRRALIGFVAGGFQISNLAATAGAVLSNAVQTQLKLGGSLVAGPQGTLSDAASAPVHIADRTWQLVVKDPASPSLLLPLALGILGLSLSALLASLIVAWRRNERMQELERQASQDALTGLNNRRRFEEDLDAAMARSRRDGSTGALLILDLDHFKRVNDSRGHQAGDELIKEVATVLRRRTRRSDAIARLGGDEFAVILPRCGREEARQVAEAISGEIRQHHDGRTAEPTSVSVGVAMFGDDPRTSVATLISEADTAMYAAKDEGRGGIRLFNPVAIGEDAGEPR
jgi:diguanylate cyclase (GGDEF)-like protein